MKGKKLDFKTHRVNVDLSLEDAEALREAAHTQRRYITDLIREAVKGWLTKHRKRS